MDIYNLSAHIYYHPFTLDDPEINKGIAEQLKKMILEDSLKPIILFEGPRGAGKSFLAICLENHLDRLCVEGKDAEYEKKILYSGGYHAESATVIDLEQAYDNLIKKPESTKLISILETRVELEIPEYIANYVSIIKVKPASLNSLRLFIKKRYHKFLLMPEKDVDGIARLSNGSFKEALDLVVGTRFYWRKSIDSVILSIKRRSYRIRSNSLYLYENEIWEYHEETKDWTEFVRKFFDMSDSFVSRSLDAARVERNLITQKHIIADTIEQSGVKVGDTLKFEKVPESVLRPLRLLSDDDQSTAWSRAVVQCKKMKPIKKLPTAKIISSIVDGMQGKAVIEESPKHKIIDRVDTVMNIAEVADLILMLERFVETKKAANE
jgi:hypothetical protein